MVKKILIALGILVVLIQFVRPAKNLSGDTQYAISTDYLVPEEISTILRSACYDCHSNTTRYPWYAEIQPAGWWLANHVREGKEELNFSDFTSLSVAVQYKKFEEIAELVEERAMPLPSYTWLGLHPDAKLSDDQRLLVISWANEQMNALRREYPADKLILKRD
jgi:hypothetical protein